MLNSSPTSCTYIDRMHISHSLRIHDQQSNYSIIPAMRRRPFFSLPYFSFFIHVSTFTILLCIYNSSEVRKSCRILYH